MRPATFSLAEPWLCESLVAVGGSINVGCACARLASRPHSPSSRFGTFLGKLDPVAADALEQSVLESKDREQLVAIASALGVKSTSRAKKADLIQKILEQTGAVPMASAAPAPAAAPAAAVAAAAPSEASAPATDTPRPAPAGRGPAGRQGAPRGAAPKPAPAAVAEIMLGADGEPLPDWEVELIRQGFSTETTAAGAAPAAAESADGDADGEGEEGAEGAEGDGLSANRRRRRRRNKNRGEGAEGDRPEGPRPDGPRADGPRNDGPRNDGERNDAQRNDGQRNAGQRQNRNDRNDRNARNERNDRYDRNDRGDRSAGGEGTEGPTSLEPVQVSGYLDLRDEGYGFLRVNGYLASRDDAYIPVKLTRQFGLRKGDFVTGLSRPAGRNEKNPALLEIHTVNGGDPEKARTRPRFEDLTPLFPDTKLHLENPSDANNMTARIIDLISPIGKGQRGIIVSPPKAGKTTIMKTIATSIERNHPEVKLIVLLIDERPEEVTDMRRTVKGEVIASTFDRPSDEHTHVAELCIEKAKRMVENGDDVVIILDGITRLSRAYNLAAPATGRIMSGGIDAGALYPPKKFFGAARNIEEGGSLTILATALVETNSRMDDAIFEEFKGTGNMELRLDRRLAERRIYPAIDVDASSTRHEELLFDRKQLQMVWKLRRVLSGLAADGNAAPGLELLIDRLRTFRTNDEFLAEISKQPAM